MLIVIAERRRRGRDGWLVALTDRERTHRRTYHRSAVTALMRVRRHLAGGHRPAFASALRDLTTAATSDLAPVRSAAD